MLTIGAWVLSGSLKRNRDAIDRELANTGRRKFFSPVMLGLYKQLVPRLHSYAVGRFLDAGCGTMPFRHYVADQVVEYRCLDVESRAEGVDYLADIQNMSVIESGAFDSALCSEVLEHVPDPGRAIAEMHRVLRVQGKLILTVPFLGRLHEEPNDYYRYTSHGLRHLLEQGGFEVIEIVPTGSVFSFLGHQLATLIVCSTYGIPILRHVTFWANAILCVLPCYWLDKVAGLASKMPLGYVAVGIRR